ncbi:putative pectin lyase F-1 [Colletotrichum siamense]|uniref:pectin lyase n=1 Tax=Colletotrichum siamense TaxID=690259 RepID=A0A9P5EQR5_COLSI|nr:putative pectin lyase F-1 [Colletotrichum siamense]KAF4857767.1 putative pectin lyase F-1 [Colletotrichum siamense]
MYPTTVLAALVALSPSLAAAQVVGTAYGFATGVTGGGSAKAAAPSDIAQLKTWLSDSTARVILIDKTFNYIGSEGTVSEKGCRAKSGCNASNGGQDTIGKDSCDANESEVDVKYDKAAKAQLTVGSNKSIVGVGSKGIIQGKGLKIPQGTKNVIIQNIHITDLNPQYVWGGDGMSIEGVDGLWIDHCKFSKAGRMFIVSHFNPSTFTISTTEFDGVTAYSNSCNKNQYWGTMFVADGDKVTLDRNWFHDMSGRAPKISGTGTTVQAVNNYFSYNLGHNFDITKGTNVLLEGNVFSNAKTPITTDSSSSGANIFDVPDSGSISTCSSSLGRNCVVNSLSGSGAWPSLKSTAALSALGKSKANLVTPIQASNVKSTVTGKAGIGKI